MKTGKQNVSALHLFFRRKTITQIFYEETGSKEIGLKRRLGSFDLITMGIGAIIGTGVFVLTGVAAARYAGPSSVLSFVLAGVASALSALVYAELASTVPVAGSAYVYAYASLGEIIAWIIGWDLILEYTVAAGAVSIGWSGYFVNLLQAAGINLPASITAPPSQGGICNLPAVFIVVLVAIILVLGTRRTANVNNIIVIVKIGVIALFIVVGTLRLNPELWVPFFPFGFKGVVTGAAIVFFAYIGFDAVSTAAEEVRDPERDLPVGIIGSLAASSVLYVLVALVLTGLVHYRYLNVPSPLSFAMLHTGFPWISGIISLGALTGLSSVILVSIFGQSRIFFAMARDGLLPFKLSRLHHRFKSPYIIIVLTATMVAIIGGFFPLEVVAELANIGTLTAFIIVSVGVIILRYKLPALHRPFKAPFFPFLPIASATISLYLVLHLPRLTWIRFISWLILGIIIYFIYSFRASRLNPEEKK